MRLSHGNRQILCAIGSLSDLQPHWLGGVFDIIVEPSALNGFDGLGLGVQPLQPPRIAANASDALMWFGLGGLIHPFDFKQ